MRGLINLVEGRKNVLIGMAEGLPVIGFIAAMCALMFLAPR